MRKTARIILGIDPGVSRTGYGVVTDDRSGVRYRTAGLIQTAAGTPHTQRLNTIHQAIVRLFRRWKPQQVAVEKLFFMKNVRTAIAVGEARGVVLLAAGETGTPLLEYTPLQVKMAVTGYGKADKRQVQLMVQRILHLDRVPTPDDVADALAVAICGAHTVQTQEALA
ncbi:MAG: crossover junction endodeoxyribonuclease RuvC [Candidatus Kerfeldbacteria bacterium]|nr:crossover junction endodeoxyribonuclease RuvC [Candidatus Kerfeldbacteria bacterium]